MDLPEGIEANRILQSELIHTMWGYHSTRLQNGHPFALANSIIDPADGQSYSHVLVKSIAEHGLIPLDIVAAVRQKADSSAIDILAQGITASMWDSLNHTLNVDVKTAEMQHLLYLWDPDILTLCNGMNRSLSVYRGITTLHSGMRVGVGAMTILAAIRHGLPPEQRFETEKLAQLLARTNDLRLGFWQMAMNIARLDPGPDRMKRYVDPAAPLGMPVATLRNHADMTEGFKGCPGRLPIGERAKIILQRYGFYGVHEGKENQPAIMLIAERVTAYVRQQLDILFSELTPEEQRTHIEKGDLMLLGKLPTPAVEK